MGWKPDTSDFSEEQVSPGGIAGQKIIETTALDRSSFGYKGKSAVYESADNRPVGGLDNLEHSLKGVKAKQDGNSPGGNVDKVKYPSMKTGKI